MSVPVFTSMTDRGYWACGAGIGTQKGILPHNED